MDRIKANKTKFSKEAHTANSICSMTNLIARVRWTRVKRTLETGLWYDWVI